MITGSEDEIEVPASPPGASIELDDPSLYISRELTWIEFNDRVLEEALDERNPLLERLKFIAIFGTNLDEYFMIRVAALKQQVEAEIHKRSDDGKLPEEQLAAIFGALHGSLDRQMRCLDEQILPALERHGIRILAYDQLDNKTRALMHKYFDDRVFPVLTPLAIDQSHPFPYISNLSLSLAVELEEASRDELGGYFARVKVPGSLPE